MRAKRVILFVIASAVVLASAVAAPACGFEADGTFVSTFEAGTDAFESSASLPDSGGTNPGDATAEGGDGGPMLPPTTVAIAAGGTVRAPTGNSQQTHLIHATHSGRWWLFTIDDLDTSAIYTYSSPDFVTWTKGASLTLPFPHSKEGGNFTVAYADIGGVDVVHLGVSLVVNAANDRRHDHARATISGSTISFSVPEELAQVTNALTSYDNPDGCATVITADGHVMDLTGWAPYNGNPATTGNACSYVSQSVDIGAAWAQGFAARGDIETVPNAVNARIAIATGGGQVVSIWEGGENEPLASNLRSANGNGSTWANQSSVFPPGHTMNANDWSAARLTNGEVHAVRRTTTQTYEHRKLVGTSWSDGQTIPALNGAVDGGLVLLAIGTRLLMLTIADDSPTSVMASSWDAAGKTWSAWKMLEGANVSRGFLSGFSAQDGNAAVIWTQRAGGMTNVVGRRVIF